MRKMKFFLAMAVVFMIQSCAVMSVRTHHTVLTDGNSVTAADLYLTTPVDKDGSFTINFILGAEGENVTTADPIEPNFLWGIGGQYQFSKKRLQPYVGFDIVNFSYLNPYGGIRYFLTNRVALNGGLGYQFRWTGWEQEGGTTKFSSGFMPSIGVTFILFNKY